MSLPTITDSRIAAPLYAIIVRVQMIPAREVSCLGGRAKVEALHEGKPFVENERYERRKHKITRISRPQ